MKDAKPGRLVHANPNSKRCTRQRTREFVLQGLYQWLLNPEEVHRINAYMRSAHAFYKAESAYFDSLLHGTITEAENLHSLLLPHLDRNMDEVSPIERAILLMATFELKNNQDIPARVILDQAIELAKSFGGTDGHKYVNSILDKLRKKLRAHEK